MATCSEQVMERKHLSESEHIQALIVLDCCLHSSHFPMHVIQRFFFWFRQILIVLLQILLFYEFDVLMCTDSSSLYLCLSLQKSSVKLVLQ